MFASIQSGDRRRSNRVRAACIALHWLLLAFILRGPTPQFLTPNSVAQGRSARATPLYFPARTEPQEAASSRARLTLPTYSRRAQRAEEKALQGESQNASPAQPSTGSPYGSGVGGPLFGPEVRPALPVVSVEPKIGPQELKGAEGDVIVEITIDDHGKIIEKKLVQSLTPDVDSRVLAALEGWQFSPATRNGVPIPSRQDVSYHFRPN